ncbi:uncharacterized protein LOC119683709 [Teleopsis dalmanni]|uniref:uncharacterized protein LOC119683401 n=1 Tax=Teleopsis dalmanni TaxID=139649 RepID=UPI0018CD2439|nr:uncharacterized protein LOC119683401 [Teleopsis dalmanni]XP_037953443.1 uncharacterized protein LOC119683709 [Teleopsis dalmanni]
MSYSARCGGQSRAAKYRLGLHGRYIGPGATAENTNNYRQRISTEWGVLESAGIATSFSSTIYGRCPIVYPRTIGLIPNYGGHIPGYLATVGKTFGDATVDAKRSMYYCRCT